MILDFLRNEKYLLLFAIKYVAKHLDLATAGRQYKKLSYEDLILSRYFLLLYPTNKEQEFQITPRFSIYLLMQTFCPCTQFQLFFHGKNILLHDVI